MRPNRCSSEEFMQILEDRISNLEQDNYVASSQVIQADEEIDEETLDALWDIANRYTTSYPVSGDWESETQHELHAIMDELGVDEATAQRYMIQVLGFSPEEFESANKQAAIEKDVLDVLAKHGYNVNTEAARNYVSNGVVPYLCQWPEGEYDAETWFQDTKMNYPEELEELKEFEEIESACNTTGMPAAVIQLDDADKIEGCGINCSTSLDGLITV